jgi:ABC-type amino acid transport system permease subunit
VTSSRSRPPFWRDVRVLAWAFQAAVAAIVVAILLWLIGNVRANS